MMQKLKTDRRPLHIQAYEHLLSLIESESYRPGDQLPPEADLSAQLGISRPTLREALFNLEQDRIIVRKHGVGTFIAPGYGNLLESGLERLESVFELAARQGKATQMRNLIVEQVPAEKELADRLDVDPGTTVTCVRRTIVVNHKPAAYMVDYGPTTILPLDALDASFSGSVLDLLMQQDSAHIREARAEITAIEADASLAEQLGIEPGRALLVLVETLFDENHAPVEFSQNYFVPDRFRFHVIRH